MGTTGGHLRLHLLSYQASVSNVPLISLGTLGIDKHKSTNPVHWVPFHLHLSRKSGRRRPEPWLSAKCNYNEIELIFTYSTLEECNNKALQRPGLIYQKARSVNAIGKITPLGGNGTTHVLAKMARTPWCNSNKDLLNADTIITTVIGIPLLRIWSIAPPTLSGVGMSRNIGKLPSIRKMV